MHFLVHQIHCLVGPKLALRIIALPVGSHSPEEKLSGFTRILEDHPCIAGAHKSRLSGFGTDPGSRMGYNRG